MARFRRRHRGDHRPEAAAQCGDSRAQLSDAGNLPLRRRPGRRQPGAGADGDESRGRRDRARRRAFHGGDREAPQSRQDRADAGSRRRLLARRFDHARRRPPDATKLSGRADHHLRQHLGRSESRIGHLLHLGQRHSGGGIARRPPRHHASRRISRPQHGRHDRRRDHRLERPLRGARAVHRPPTSRTSATTIPA